MSSALEPRTNLKVPSGAADPGFSPNVPSTTTTPLVQKFSSNNGDGHANGSASAKAVARQRFQDVFPQVRDSLLNDFHAAGMPEEATEWFKRSLNTNVPGGKLNRGMSVVDTLEILNGRALTQDEYTKAAVLGWCVEFLQALFLITDDIMDQSVTRRGLPCWYRQEGVGNIAINDALTIEMSIYRLLKIHFRSEPYYVDLLDLFHEVTYQTELGQLVDLITAPEDHVDLSKFSLERHRLIVAYKTAYYSFYMPVALAMHMAGIPCKIPFSSTLLPFVSAAPAPSACLSSDRPATTLSASSAIEAEAVDPYFLTLQILLPLGEYFQVQDDFLDFAGTPEQIGKIGTDILDNKCSWCVNTAIALATPAQRQVLDENYGKKDATCEARVKALYEEMDIRGRYKEYEEKAYNRIMGLIETIPPSGMPMPATASGRGGSILKREVFKVFLDKIYKRSK